MLPSAFAAATNVRVSWVNTIGELVNGIPARVWDFSSPGGASQWGQTTFGVYAADSVMLRPRFNMTAGLRLPRRCSWRSGSPDVTPSCWMHW